MITFLSVYAAVPEFQDLPTAIICLGGLLLLFLGLAILVSVWSKVYSVTRQQQESEVVDAEYEIIEDGDEDGSS